MDPYARGEMHALSTGFSTNVSVLLTAVILIASVVQATVSARRRWDLAYFFAFLAGFPALLWVWISDEVAIALVTIALALGGVLAGWGISSVILALVFLAISVGGTVVGYTGIAWWGALLFAFLVQLVGFETVRDRVRQRKKQAVWSGKESGGPYALEGKIDELETISLPMELDGQAVSCACWWLRQNGKILAKSAACVPVRTAHGTVDVELQDFTSDVVEHSSFVADDALLKHFPGVEPEPGGSASLCWLTAGQIVCVTAEVAVEAGASDEYRGAGLKMVLRSTEQNKLELADRSALELLRDGQIEGMLWGMWALVYGAVAVARLVRP